MVAGLDTDIEFEYHCNVLPEVNDELMGKLPPASVVINATGMGKDLPGSPITDQGLFPIGGVAWELNYRGELRFLHQALAQRAARQVRVEDGWLWWPARSANPRSGRLWVARSPAAVAGGDVR
jgi:shikimate 5-dehydrogenase